MSDQEIPQLVRLGAYDDGECDACRKHFTHGGGLTDTSGQLLVSLCQWCIALWLEEVTNWLFSEQLLDWEVKKNVWTKARRRARERKMGVTYPNESRT